MTNTHLHVVSDPKATQEKEAQAHKPAATNEAKAEHAKAHEPKTAEAKAEPHKATAHQPAAAAPQPKLQVHKPAAVSVLHNKPQAHKPAAQAKPQARKAAASAKPKASPGRPKLNKTVAAPTPRKPQPQANARLYSREERSQASGHSARSGEEKAFQPSAAAFSAQHPFAGFSGIENVNPLFNMQLQMFKTIMSPWRAFMPWLND